MALIQCPECGQTVSDKAEVCIHCGAPLRKILRPAKIKTSKKHLKVKIYDCFGGEMLWEGRGGEVASLKIDKPTRINYNWDVLGHSTNNYLEQLYEISPGEKYEEVEVSSFFGGKFGLNQVDVIDSE